MKKILLLICIFAYSISTNAQEFLRPFNSISTKKISYITLEDGTELETAIKSIKRKKGQIKGFSYKDSNKNKVELNLEDVKFIYIPQSNLDKLNNFADFAHNSTQWSKSPYDQERFKQGYAYFEKVSTKVKKKKMLLMLQLLNPSNPSRIKVFHDIIANESGGFGVGGIQLSKSIDKSFYVQKDNNTAYRIHKSDFKKEIFQDLFGDCEATVEKYGDKPKWINFEEMIFFYNDNCGS